MRKMVDGSYWFEIGEVLSYGHRSYQIPPSFIRSDILDDGAEIYSRGKHGRMVQSYQHPVWGDGFIVDKVKYNGGDGYGLRPGD